MVNIPKWDSFNTLSQSANIPLFRTRRTCRHGYLAWWYNHSKAGTQIARARLARNTRMLLGWLWPTSHFADKMYYRPHKVTQYKKGKDSLFAQGKRRYDRKQSGYGGQTKPVFHKKVYFLCLRHSFLLDWRFNRPRQPRKSFCDWNAQYVNTRCSSPWSVANSESRITVFVCVNISLFVASNSVAKRRPRVQLLLLYVRWHRVLVACSFRLVMSSCRSYVAFNIPNMITHAMIRCRDYWKFWLHSSLICYCVWQWWQTMSLHLTLSIPILYISYIQCGNFIST